MEYISYSNKLFIVKRKIKEHHLKQNVDLNPLKVLWKYDFPQIQDLSSKEVSATSQIDNFLLFCSMLYIIFSIFYLNYLI